MADLAYYLKISNHLAGNLDIRSALRSVKSEINQIIPVDHLDVCLIDEDGLWNTCYEVGLRTSWSTNHSLIDVSPVRDILVGKTDHMLTGNAMEDARYTFEGAASEPIFSCQLRSRVNVAMKVLGQTIGSLNCSSLEEDFYDDDAIAQVSNLADILAPYFYALRATDNAKREAIMRAEVQAREEGLRLGALSLTEGLEQERRRIGMDLHDQTLADLTRLSRDLESARGGMGKKDMLRQLQDCIQGLRDIIDMSIPSILELFGFQHAIRTHLERAIQARSGTRFEVHDRSNGKIDELSETHRTALFRIAQEAVNNAVKHAEATLIEVVIEEDNGLRLTVRDDGISIDNMPADRLTGGLSHMRTRARLIAADFTMNTTSGTEVVVHLTDPDFDREGDAA